jgi:putative transposase
MKEFYRRNLPHWLPAGGIFFITYRLKDSLPKNVINRIREDLQIQIINAQGNDQLIYKAQKRFLINIDESLDKAEHGPHWLKEKDISEIVYKAWIDFDKIQYDLYALCIMSNHVHVLFEHYTSAPHVTRIMQMHKTRTAKLANKILDRTGNPFWAEESYDHCVRVGELGNIRWYILNNPVKAGLVTRWEDWKWMYNYSPTES